jgi:hypothetical protein
MNRAGFGIGLAAGLAMSLLHADAAPDPNIAAQQKAAAHAEWLQETAIGREAIAKRYGSCAIAKVVDHHESKPQQAVGFDGRNRDRVEITVQVSETPVALAQEKKYDKDDAVMWMPTDLMARERVPGKQGVEALGTTIPGQTYVESVGHATTVTRTVYPYASRTSGNVGVFVAESTETLDYEGGKDYNDFGAKFCGMIVLDKLADGGYEWREDTAQSPMDDIYRVENCALTEDPHNPGSFSSDC